MQLGIEWIKSYGRRFDREACQTLVAGGGSASYRYEPCRICESQSLSSQEEVY